MSPRRTFLYARQGRGEGQDGLWWNGRRAEQSSLVGWLVVPPWRDWGRGRQTMVVLYMYYVCVEV